MDRSPTYTTFASGGRLFARFDDGTVLPVVRGGDGDTDLAALLAQAADPSAVEDLAALEADLEAEANRLAETGLTDDVLARLDEIATAVEAVRAESVERQTAEQERTDRAAELLERIRGQEDGGDGGEDGDGDGTPDEADENVAPPAVPEVAPEEEARTPEPVAASARPAPRVGRVAARRPTGLPRTAADLAPRPRLSIDRLPEWGLTAAVDSTSRTAGQTLETVDHVADAFEAALNLSLAYRGPKTKFPVFRSGTDRAETIYGPARFLNRDSKGNAAKIAAVTGPDAIMSRAHMSPEQLSAAGGICANPPLRYDLPIIGDDSRPVRAMLARFGADRGGVKTIPPPTLADVATGDAVTVWTEANDVTPSDPTTKPCITLTCPAEDETIVDAITQCLEAGEFRRRFFGEQVDAWLRLIAVHHAREAETRLLETIGDGSKAITVSEGLGATRDVLAGLDRALAIFASSHRAFDTMWRFAAPFWLLNMIRTDLAREMPGSSEERLAMADAQILAIFRVHGVTPTFFLDGEAGQVFGVQADNANLAGWPDTVVTYLYPEGSWLFLDGGSFQAGWYRDSTLIETNDARFFGETFEAAHFHGVDSWRLTFDVCPSGLTAGTSDFDPCVSGS